MNIPTENIIFEKDYEQGKFVTFDRYPDADFLTVNQVHGNRVVFSSDHVKNDEADGIATLAKDQQLNLCIKTADCVPLLCLGKDGFAMIHAGWRGIKENIHTDPKISEISPTLFFIGPSASVGYYEVQSDFKENFPHSNAFSIINGSLFFDLKHELADRIKKSFPSSVVEISDECTISNPKFHSYRRDRTDKRNWNVFFPSKR
jgi:hypothetical protein